MRKLSANILFFITAFFINTVVLADSTQQLFRQTNSMAGNPNGEVTAVEFFDYQCSHCVTMALVMDKAIQSNKELRVVFRDLPIRGEVSELAAEAALAAGFQGKYYELHRALFSLGGSFNEEDIYKVAAEHNIDVKQLKQDMQSRAVKKYLEENKKLAKELNVSGTPAFFVGKTNANSLSNVNFVLGEMSQDELQKAIDRARQ